MLRCNRWSFGSRILPVLLVAGLAGPAGARSIAFGPEGFTFTLPQQKPCFKKEIKSTDFTRADLQAILEQLQAAKEPHGHYYAKAAAELAEALKNHEYSSVEEKLPKAKTTLTLDDSTRTRSSHSSSSSSSGSGQPLKKEQKDHDLPGISRIKLHAFGSVKGHPRLPMVLDDSGRTLKFIGVSLDATSITAMDGDGNDVVLAQSAPIESKDMGMVGLDDVEESLKLRAAVESAQSAGKSNYFITDMVNTDHVVSMFIDPDGTLDFTTSESKLWRIPKKGNLQFLGSWGQGTRSNPFGDLLLERNEQEETLGLAGERDGVRFIADAIENQIYRVTLTGKGEAEFKVIAGNGGRFNGDTEAVDASKVGLTPMGITVDEKGIVTFVEFADQGVRQLIPTQDGTYRLSTLMAGHKNCDSGSNCFWMQRLKAERGGSPEPSAPSRWMRRIALGPDGELLVVDNFTRTITDTAAKVTRNLGDLGSAFKNNKDLRIGHFGRVPGGLLFQVFRKNQFDGMAGSEVFLASTRVQKSEAETLMKIAVDAMHCKSQRDFVKLKKELADADPDKDSIRQQLNQYFPSDLASLTLSYTMDASLHWRVQTLLRNIRGREKELKKDSRH